MKKKGFTLMELMAASTIMLLILGGLIVVFGTFQISWRGGNAQIFLQMQARLAMNKMVRVIRPGLAATTLNGNNTLKVNLDPNHTATTADDIWCQYDYANNAITYTPNINTPAAKSTILQSVYKVNNNPIFSINGKTVTIMFSVLDTTAGLPTSPKRSYVETSVTLRNQ